MRFDAFDALRAFDEEPREPEDPLRKLPELLDLFDLEDALELLLLFEELTLFLAEDADLLKDFPALLFRLLLELREPPLVPDAFAVLVIMSPFGRFPVGLRNHFSKNPPGFVRGPQLMVNADVNQVQ